MPFLTLTGLSLSVKRQKDSEADDAEDSAYSRVLQGSPLSVFKSQWAPTKDFIFSAEFNKGERLTYKAACDAETSVSQCHYRHTPTHTCGGCQSGGWRE